MAASDRSTSSKGTSHASGAVRICGLTDRDLQITGAVQSFSRVSDLLLFSSLEHLFAAIPKHRPESIILGLHDVHGRPTSGAVRVLRTRWPRMGIVAVLRVSVDSARFLGDWVRAGVDEVLFASETVSLETMRCLLSAVRSRHAREASWEPLRSVLPREAWPFLEHCLRHADRPIRVGDLAIHFDLERTTLAARLGRLGLPPARTLIAWSRALALIDVLDREPVSIGELAERLHFANDAKVRQLTRRLVGCSPRAILTRGGAEWLRERFRALLVESRVARSQQRSAQRAMMPK